jgi:hypothetical protein
MGLAMDVVPSDGNCLPSALDKTATVRRWCLGLGSVVHADRDGLTHIWPISSLLQVPLGPVQLRGTLCDMAVPHLILFQQTLLSPNYCTLYKAGPNGDTLFNLDIENISMDAITDATDAVGSKLGEDVLEWATRRKQPGSYVSMQQYLQDQRQVSQVGTRSCSKHLSACLTLLIMQYWIHFP